MTGNEEPNDPVVRNFQSEIKKTFMMLDADRSGELEMDEFVEGLMQMTSGSAVNDRHVLLRTERLAQSTHDHLYASVEEDEKRDAEVMARFKKQEDRLDRIEKLLEKVIKNTDRSWANTSVDAAAARSTGYTG